MNFAKINIKKLLLFLLIALLAGYVLRDVYLRTVSNFQLQGYAIAVNELVEQAENRECLPFNIFFGEKKITLINVDCLQIQPEEEPVDMEF